MANFRMMRMLKQRLTYKDDIPLSYAEYGDPRGYPILVQHGLIASIDDYALFDRLLKANIRLICMARPGYGESPPYEMQSFSEWGDIVSHLVTALRLPQFDVLGISSGAPYAYSIGYRLPGNVRHIYILSGIPALYDALVISRWPYPAPESNKMEDLQALARALFFSRLTAHDLQKNDIRDSTMYNCFGVAQDLRLRFTDWGFRLSDLKANVFIRHSKQDDSVPVETAVRTSQLLDHCQLELTETDPHFSSEVLDDFLEMTVLKHM